MPPRCKFTKEEIVNAAFHIARKEGLDSITARRVSSELGSSSKVIFTWFDNMDQLQNDVLNRAYEEFAAKIEKALQRSDMPPYKASGMAYIELAKEDRELFKMLFMCDLSENKETAEDETTKSVIKFIQASTGLDEASALKFHEEMWIFVHGIATMIATSYRDWDMDYISDMLTDCFIGLKYRYCGEEKENGSH